MIETELPLAFLNFQDGGLVHSPAGVEPQTWHYEWAKLDAAFEPCVGNAPVVIMLNEAKEYGRKGSLALLAAAERLSTLLGRCYDARLGWHPAGDYPPAIFWDSQVLALRAWRDLHDSVPVHWRNVADFGLRRRPAEVVRFAVDHWDFQSPTVRFAEAEKKSHLADSAVPTILAGDFNGTASGDHLPQRRWLEVPIKRRRHKGTKGADGEWSADTRPVDYLIGEWDSGRKTRVDGIGFHALCEIAHQQGMAPAEAFRPTVNTGVDLGGPLLIDWILANNAWADGLLPGSYRVHVPPETPTGYPSDHRLVTATMRI